jgi:hypothetical protein
MTFGKRAALYSGTAPLLEIFEAEMTGELINRTQMEVGYENIRLKDGNLESELESELDRAPLR